MLRIHGIIGWAMDDCQATIQSRTYGSWCASAARTLPSNFSHKMRDELEGPKRNCANQEKMGKMRVRSSFGCYLVLAFFQLSWCCPWQARMDGTGQRAVWCDFQGPHSATTIPEAPFWCCGWCSSICKASKTGIERETGCKTSHLCIHVLDLHKSYQVCCCLHYDFEMYQTFGCWCHFMQHVRNHRASTLWLLAVGLAALLSTAAAGGLRHGLVLGSMIHISVSLLNARETKIQPHYEPTDEGPWRRLRWGFAIIAMRLHQEPFPRAASSLLQHCLAACCYIYIWSYLDIVDVYIYIFIFIYR